MSLFVEELKEFFPDDPRIKDLIEEIDSFQWTHPHIGYFIHTYEGGKHGMLVGLLIEMIYGMALHIQDIEDKLRDKNQEEVDRLLKAISTE